MRLNPDCLRDILICVEETTDLDNPLIIEPGELPPTLQTYSPEEVMYHIKQAELSNLIVVNSWFIDGSCLIKYLSPDGHQFVGNIQSEKIWDKVKSIAQTIGINTISSLVQIASNVALSAIQSHL